MKAQNWTLLVLGVWVLISPWILGFFEISAALFSNVVAGLAIAIIMMRKIFGDKNEQDNA